MDIVKRKWKPYIFFIALAEGVGFLSGWLSREGTAQYSQSMVKPPLSPPGWVFPVVWTILFALMGFGAARVYNSPQSSLRSRGLNLFVLQLLVNFFWSLIFFNAGRYGLAYFWLMLLLILVGAMTVRFYRVAPVAGLAQIPYLLWLVFASYLNFGVWYLNR